MPGFFTTLGKVDTNILCLSTYRRVLYNENPNREPIHDEH